MSKELNKMIYGLTPLQKSWSKYKIRVILNAKWPARKAKNYFYAELLLRKLETK